MPTFITHEKLDAVRTTLLVIIGIQLLQTLLFAGYFILKDHNKATEINVTLGIKKAGE
jgi:hypothetical protein